MFAAAQFIPQLMQELEDGPLRTYTPCHAEGVEAQAEALAITHAELILVHPFREGNGRTAFIVGNLLLMQNDMPPLNVYNRRRDEKRYYAACEAGRIRKDYQPLATLIAEWTEEALNQWEESHGQA